MGSVRTLNRRNTIRLTLSALCLLGAATLVRPASAAATDAAAPAIQNTSRQAVPSRQLADEITRRLRRLGISFSPSRIPHPYDDGGEAC